MAEIGATDGETPLSAQKESEKEVPAAANQILSLRLSFQS